MATNRQATRARGKSNRAERAAAAKQLEEHEGVTAPMPNVLKSLFAQVVVALVLGILLGILYPSFAIELKPLGDGFIKLIKMLIPLIVFCVVVHGIAGAGELTKVGRVGVKAIVYFEGITTIALGLGILLAYVFQPGVGMNIDPASLDPKAMSGYVDRATQVASGGTVDFLMKIIPTTVFAAFTSGDVLQVLLFSIIFGCALSLVGERGEPILQLVERGGVVLFRAMTFIIRLAPLGVLGAIAFTVGKYGIGSLKQLGYLVGLFYVTVGIFVVLVLGTVMRLVGFSLFKLLRYMREELLVVLGTAAGDSVLPQTMRKMEKLGIGPSTVGLVIPTGYSFNLDAFSIYLTLAAVFIAQATNTPLAMTDLLAILGIALITSKGAHGVPGSAIVILAATLAAIPAIPAIGLVLVLAVDWFMGIARALGNYIGNCVATVVVGAWERDIDHERAHKVLDGKVDVDDEAIDRRLQPVPAE
jgi:aerobic C4-dicarboxylate transport protein